MSYIATGAPRPALASRAHLLGRGCLELLRRVGLAAVVCGTLGSCGARGPLSRGPLLGVDLYKVAIDFSYRGAVYHGRWVHACDAYRQASLGGGGSSYSVSRWGGFAMRLPDGSAVLFKPRADVCAPSPSDPSSYGGHLIGGSAEPAAAPRDLAVASPVVYWFDSATQPTKVEACIVRQCSERAGARVQVLGFAGGRASETQPVSDPEEELPALKESGGVAGAAAFLGYSCWVIPAEAAKPSGHYNPVNHAKLANSPYAFERLEDIDDTVWERRELLFNGITWLAPSTYRTFSFRDIGPNLFAPDLPEKRWYRPCHREGAVIVFDNRSDGFGAPMVLTPLRDSGPPDVLRFPGGTVTPAGIALPPGHPAGHFLKPQDPDRFSTAVSGAGGSVIVAEAHVLSMNQKFD